MSIIQGQNPCNLTYDTRLLRNYLRNCLQLGQITFSTSHMRNGPKDRIAGSSVNIKYIEYFAAVDGYHDFLDLEKCIKTNKWLSVRIVGSGSIAFVLIFLLISFF